MLKAYYSDREDMELAFCQEALKKGYLSHDIFKKCLRDHSEIVKMGLSKPTLREIVESRGELKPESITEIMAVLGARSGKRAIEGYKLLEKVSSGAFGSIYRAKQDSMDREVALKVLPRRLALNEKYVANFMRETKLAARLAHENIVYVLDAGQSAGLLYLAMEFVKGPTLEKMVLKKGPMEEKAILNYIWHISQGLSHAHDTGILHRDIKPANILVEGGKTPKVCDFGLAKSIAMEALMEASGIMGTPSYMAPEQIVGGNIDQRTDVYGLGATVYFMASAKPPFKPAKTFEEVYENQIKMPVRPLRDVNPEVSGRIADIVMKMMHREQERRFEDFDEVIEAVVSMMREMK